MVMRGEPADEEDAASDDDDDDDEEHTDWLLVPNVPLLGLF